MIKIKDKLNSPYVICNYFLEKSIEDNIPITAHKMLKLIYVTNGWYLALYNDPLIYEDVKAWDYGPIIESVYHKYKSFKGKPIHYKSHEIFYNNDFLNKTWDTYKRHSSNELATLCNMEGTPWNDIYIRYKGKIPYNTIITNDEIKEYYREKLIS